MLSLTLVFHVVSALAFLVCIVWIVRLNQERRFWRQIWEASRANPQKKWILDWPHSFLRKICHTMGCRFESSAHADRPCRIQLQVWIELDRLARIEGIRLEKQNKLLIFLANNLASQQQSEWVSRLEDSLEQQYEIQILSAQRQKGADG